MGTHANGGATECHKTCENTDRSNDNDDDENRVYADDDAWGSFEVSTHLFWGKTDAGEAIVWETYSTSLPSLPVNPAAPTFGTRLNTNNPPREPRDNRNVLSQYVVYKRPSGRGRGSCRNGCGAFSSPKDHSLQVEGQPAILQKSFEGLRTVEALSSSLKESIRNMIPFPNVCIGLISSVIS